jgi:hypothetical protein
VSDQKTTSPGAGLPCLFSHISNENPGKVKESDLHCKDKEFTTARKKSAFILAESVELMASKYGLNKLGFLTLTFSDHVTEPSEAQRRLNSLITRVIKPRYGDYVGVFERQKSGRIHYHLLVHVGVDIRQGVNFEELKNCNYRSAGKDLRSEWAFWRNTAKKYRFGRTELLPVKSSTTAIKYYIGKYISKSFFSDGDDKDKGVRLTRYSRGARAGTSHFSFLTKNSEFWRESVGLFAELVGDEKGVEVDSIDSLSILLGERWAYKYRGYILGISEILDALRLNGVNLDREELKKGFNVNSVLRNEISPSDLSDDYRLE